MGPKEPASTVLSLEEEAIIVAFRKHTLLPLDDCLYALQATIPNLTRSSLHRCLQRRGIGRRPATDGDKPSTRTFRAYPIGYVHIDIAAVRTGEGKLHLFVAIDRTSKFACAELHHRADRKTATLFLKALLKAVPYKIHAVLTDNGIQLADLPKNRTGPTALWRGHMFDLLCQQHGIEHRLTKPNHPWTNGQVERRNRTLKEATVNRYHYESHAQLKQHLHAFLMAYNFARRLKTLRGLTPGEHICKVWTGQPKRFKSNPLHHALGLNTRAISEKGGRTLAVQADVSDSAALRNAVDNIASTFGGLDTVIAATGIALTGTVNDMREADWHRILGVNLRHSWLTSGSRCFRSQVHWVPRSAASIPRRISTTKPTTIFTRPSSTTS